MSDEKTEIRDAKENEMKKFLEDTQIQRNFKTWKELKDRLCEGRVIKVNKEFGTYKGNQIENRHIVMDDNTVISLSGTAVLKQIDNFFTKNPPPINTQMTVIETIGKDDQMYREFRAKVI